MSIPERFSCFPGTVAGGPIATLLECHGNWAAAIRLMDDACLPRPPLTVTYSIALNYRDTTPPCTPLTLTAQVRRHARFSRAAVHVRPPWHCLACSAPAHLLPAHAPRRPSTASRRSLGEHVCRRQGTWSSLVRAR